MISADGPISMETFRATEEDPEIHISKSLWSKGDMVLAHESLEIFPHRPWGHIAIPKDAFLQRHLYKVL